MTLQIFFILPVFLNFFFLKYGITFHIFMVPAFLTEKMSNFLLAWFPTNFPDFSSIFHSFPVFFKVLYVKCGTIFARVFTITGLQISLTFPVFSSIFFSDFPVLWVKFPPFPVLAKSPDWKILPHFSRFSSLSGNHVIRLFIFPVQKLSKILLFSQ